MSAIQFAFTTEGKNHYATANGGPRFFVGDDVRYEERRGLRNLATKDGPVYRAADWVGQHGHWAHLLQPTAQCESMGSFHCLNSYDRAAFTFGFTQSAAHVPDGDFVKLLRALLALPEAPDYFPYLRLRGGRIVYERDGVVTPLETPTSTAELMKYLNPDAASVGEQERICAARFVHWAQQSAAHRAVQVQIAVEVMKSHMKVHAKKLELDGYPDYICHALCDVYHQGRADYAAARSIMHDAPSCDAAYERILDLGKAEYASRIDTLRAEHKKLRTSGVFGRTYRMASGEFV